MKNAIRPNSPGWSRRRFLGTAASVASASLWPRDVRGQRSDRSGANRLNIACIGVGGKGFDNVRNAMSEDIVALCDVDFERGAKAFQMFPDARRYRDYRELLEKEADRVDAVIVSTSDHHHIPAGVMAMRLGKHVYCEKPLGQNIGEIRLATRVAAETGVATQMGNGAHSGANYRGVAKLIKEGIIGEVREVHCWCDEAWEPGDRPPNRPRVPPNLDWDLWLGPAPVRPYHPCYHPLSWRHWWDFGNGRLGDMGCHMIDLPFTALDLKYPLTVEARSHQPAHPESASKWLVCTWTFPARGGLPQVELTWYHGGKRPPLQRENAMPDYPEGTLFVGSRGMLIADYGHFKLYPEDQFEGVRLPRLPRLGSHMGNWIEACKTGRPTGTRFDYAGPLAETVLLGVVAYRVGHRIEWDAEKLRVTNSSEADRFVRRDNREGWVL